MLAASAGQVVSIDQSASSATLARQRRAKLPVPRRGRIAIASRPKKPRIASPRVAPSPRSAGKSRS